MKDADVPAAHFGSPRINKPGDVTRVELRLPTPLGARLYRLAQANGQSVSRVGADLHDQRLTSHSSWRRCFI
ncbi:hypothetical protein [Gordonia rhizosphera]|uniref:Uncharacterized protein n=1 Tax=Gordonia rhizosphera NBRC 16068 TaxID=1108045 RepID=K6W0Q2_9ACTN|nr:hypothetical protein [Gordonia rhizosphera]GAB92750.1 hypothetical protein GORHZ_191_00090 [Gordonia rhizosphera NBRC 16068]